MTMHVYLLCQHIPTKLLLMMPDGSVNGWRSSGFWQFGTSTHIFIFIQDYSDYACVNILSTYSDGTPPDDARWFCKFLEFRILAILNFHSCSISCYSGLQ